MRIIKSYVKVDAMELNCKLLQKPRRVGYFQPRKRKAFQFVAGGGFVLWISDGEKYENMYVAMYRYKFAVVLLLQRNSRFITSSECFLTLNRRIKTAFDSSKFKHLI